MVSGTPRTLSHTLLQWAFLTLLIAAPFIQITGCAGPSYYAQAMSGHFRLMRDREDIVQILSTENVDPELAQDLELANELREFAISQLELPNSGSYRQYVKTNQSAVTWNVVAAPEFSLEPRQWCFMVSGCVPYRGYFKHEAAENFADKQARDGYDVTVSPAVAYSTLGWFDDPLLDTMFQYDDEQLAALIFHEMAHQQLYVKGDTAFNEAFASFVEETGVKLWLEAAGSSEQLAGWRQLQKASLRFNALLLDTRESLYHVFASSLTEPEMRGRKSAIFNELRQDYRELVQEEWNGRSYFESWFSRELNNARFALMSSYHGGACAFEKLYRLAAGDMAGFHQLARDKAQLNKEQRSAWLNQPCEVIASSRDL